MLRLLLLFLISPWLTALCASEAQGQVQAQALPGTGSGAPLRPSVRLEPLASGESIDVDGQLDEAVWSTAARVGPLTQTRPIEGAPMGVETDVRLTFDADFIYVGLSCYDDPSEIRARQMERDAFVRYDDVVELWLDPFNSGRFAYWFQVTPGGSLGDALIADNGSSFNKDWDGIWYGATSITDEGWFAELAFPIKTLSYDPDAPYWGFNVRRKRVADGTQGRWASPYVAYNFFQVSDGGRLLGIKDLRQGVGLDVTPYVKTLFDRPQSDASFGSEWDSGVDLRWRPTPTSTVLVTTNTDFAETEVDTRQINVGRFPLFFPERRDFFLEDAGAFEFGAPSNRRSVLPFFSRTVGRDEEGAVVPILAGVKFTGRFGDWTIGALDTYVDGLDARPASVDVDARAARSEQNLGVLRAQRSLGEGQAVGAIFTTGDPGGDGNRYTVGADLRLGSARLFGAGHSGFVWGYVLGTGGGDGDQQGLAFGLEAQTRSKEWQTDLRLRRVEEGFDPALGFVRRSAVDRLQVGAERAWRSEDTSSLFRQVEVGADVVMERDLDGEEDGWSVPLDLFDLQFWSQDSLRLRLTRRAETIEDAFDVGDNAAVQPGDYDETRYRLTFESNDRRVFGLETSLEVGDYYGGEIRRARIEPVWIPNRHLAVTMSFEDVDIDLDSAGTLHTQLYGWRVDVGIDPFTSWKTFVQYDTDNKDLSAQSRIRWILEPGRELFLVGLFGFSKEDHRASFVSGEQSLAVKLEFTLRF